MLARVSQNLVNTKCLKQICSSQKFLLVEILVDLVVMLIIFKMI
jgi:hypothetical protein